MGFDIYGRKPSSDAGKYFRNTIWWWRPLRLLITLSCADILTIEDMRKLEFNDGHLYSPKKAEAIASRLGEIAADEKLLSSYETEIKRVLPEIYKDCWSKDNILEFVEFLRNSGGFQVY
jgi:hypothetical protein